MSALRGALADYLALRRGLGFKLDRAEKLLGQFIAHLEARNTTTVTVAEALAWATAPPGGGAKWQATRMSVVRAFAAYLHTLDPAHQVPPAGLLRGASRQTTPYLYSASEISALLQAASQLPRPLAAATYQTLIGLLAVTGMRIGEALGLDRGDLDTEQGVLTVRQGKFGKSRSLPLHPSATAALTGYLRLRDRQHPTAATDALLVSTVGTRLRHNSVWRTFHRLTRQAGLQARSAACRPRIHDLRHSFAVATLLEWYRNDADIPALLPRLSTYLGHADPKHTYWYLTAAPELLTLAADRLQRHQQQGREGAG